MLTRSSIVAGLLLATVSTAALAQTSTDESTTAPSAAEPTTPPATEPTAPAVEPSVTPDPAAPATETTTQAEPNANTNVAADVGYEKRQGDMRASDLIGKRVYNDANEDIGEIDELIVNSDGKVAAVIVGVGGFLGMGERKVALPFTSLKMQAGADGGDARWTTDMTRDRLVNAPEWQWTAAQ